MARRPDRPPGGESLLTADRRYRRWQACGPVWRLQRICRLAGAPRRVTQAILIRLPVFPGGIRRDRSFCCYCAPPTCPPTRAGITAVHRDSTHPICGTAGIAAGGATWKETRYGKWERSCAIRWRKLPMASGVTNSARQSDVWRSAVSDCQQGGGGASRVRWKHVI